MANVCCSIEMEPRTLSEGQLNHAREAAADVVQKMEQKNASTESTKGTRSPVVPIKKMDDEIEKNENQDDDHDKPIESKEKAAEAIIDRPCQCSCNGSNIEESPDQINLKEPLSAPF